MEGERRKRKLQNEEESEEQKMEQFFALIRSTKDVRDRLSNKENEDKAKGVWNPTFQPGDFVIEYQDLVHNNDYLKTAPAGPSTTEAATAAAETEAPPPPPPPPPPEEAPTEENEDKDKGSDHLDLTLSL